jgi:yeast amino acid transporter
MAEHGTYPSEKVFKESKGDESVLEPVQSVGEAYVGDLEQNRNGQFHRSFSPRQVHVSYTSLRRRLSSNGPQVISLGSNIGSGLFIATGKALANGGPGNVSLPWRTNHCGFEARISQPAITAARIAD